VRLKKGLDDFRGRAFSRRENARWRWRRERAHLREHRRMKFRKFLNEFLKIVPFERPHIACLNKTLTPWRCCGVTPAAALGIWPLIR
jgi:hypothetical protein